MSFDPYTTGVLAKVVSNLKSPLTFWSEKFFKSTQLFDSEEIIFDNIVSDNRRLAPFVSPNAQGQIMGQEGYSTKSFKPAYIKPMHVVRPNQALKRKAGEQPIAGGMSPQARMDAIVRDLLQKHVDMHTMTKEWMAARAIIDGAVTVTGENYPSQVVEFGRDAALTVVKAGAAAWDQGTSTKLKDIRDMRNLVKQKSGAVVKDIIFGTAAWDEFIVDTEVTALLDKNLGGSESDFTRVTEGLDDTVEYVGTLRGSQGGGYRMWVCSQKYVDDAGAEQDMLDPNDVVGVAETKVDGIRAFGAILDVDVLRAQEMFSKQWVENNPSRKFLGTESAPLMIPAQPNATFKMTVL